MFSLVTELEYANPESALAPTGVESLAWLAYQFSESSFGEGRLLVNVPPLGKQVSTTLIHPRRREGRWRLDVITKLS